MPFRGISRSRTVLQGTLLNQLPFESDLVFKSSSRVGNTITDSFGNDAKILPAVFKGNGTSYYNNSTNNFLSTDDWTYEVNVLFDNVVSNASFIRQNTTYFNYIHGTGWVVQAVGSSVRGFTVSLTTLPNENREYKFRLVHSKTGSTTLYENNVQIGTSNTGGFTNVGNDNVQFGRSQTGTVNPATVCLKNCKIWSDTTKITLVAHYEFTGSLVATWDLSGNGNNAVLVGVAPAGFHYLASTYLLDNGFTLWQKTGAVDIYIPYGGQVTLPAVGYDSALTYAGSATEINMAPCLIGFNETSSDAPALEIYDRSNTTRQEDLSRLSAYYDSTSLATKCRYYIDEIFNYGIRTDYFKAGYKNKSFAQLKGSGYDLRIVSFLLYGTEKTKSQATRIKSYIHTPQSLTVGTGKNTSAILKAFRVAFDNCYITIDTGTFAEVLDLTVKQINLIGSGTLETMLYKPADTTSNVINIKTESTFNNLVVRKTGANTNPTINIDSCSPRFTNFKIYKPFDNNYAPPMTIDNGSIVNFSGIIDSSEGALANLNDITVKNGSTFNFIGTTFKARLKVLDTSIVNLITDYFWTESNGNYLGLTASGDSVTNLTINTGEISMNNATGNEVTAGTYSQAAYNLSGNASLTLQTKQITGSTIITGAAVNVLYKNIVSTLGHFWVITSDLVTNAASIVFDNCQIVQDVDSDSTGLHIIEETKDASVSIINGSILEFSGHSGNWNTMGNPVAITGNGNLLIEDSEIIDNINDGVPFGSNYTATLLIKSKTIIKNSIIRNKNYDGVCKNNNINIFKELGKPLQLTLENVEFINDVSTGNGGNAIKIIKNAALEATDFIKIIGTVTNHTQEANIATNMTDFNLLISQAPD